MSDKSDIKGEGNPDADKRYREDVQSTVSETTGEERAEQARNLSKEELADARAAEKEGKARSRS